MRRYAEQTWGRWDGRAELDVEHSRVIQVAGVDVGLLEIHAYLDRWQLRRLYVAPSWQGRGIGSQVLRQVLREAGQAGVRVRLSVLEVNPARAFYERHGFGVTQTVPPRYEMEWPIAARRSGPDPAVAP